MSRVVTNKNALAFVPESSLGTTPSKPEWIDLSADEHFYIGLPVDDGATRATCDECNGTGTVELFTSVVPCSRGCKP